MSFRKIREFVDDVSTWNPVRDSEDDLISYIDLSSVDQNTKNITSKEQIKAVDAPSRARQLVRSGDILVSTVRPNLNGVAKVPPALDGATASTGFCVLRPKVSEIDGSFLFQWVKASSFISEMTRVSTGASYPAVSDRIVLDSLIPAPSLIEQKRIGAILDRAEALRAKRRQALAKLDALTQSLFLDLFGDPRTNLKRWPIRAVADYVREFQGGKSLQPESDENIVTRNRVLKISAVTGMKFLSHESKPVPDSYLPPSEHFTKPGDLLFSRANTTELVGAVAYVDHTPPNVLLPDKLWRFVWQEPATIEPLFVWALFQTEAVRQEVGRRATGTSDSMKNISQQKVFGIRTILPPIEVQREFARQITAVEKLKAAHRASLAKLDALFASLQHRAFSGQL